MGEADKPQAVRQLRPELLAPAGDWEALHAAVANGADAVYFGLEAFNARRRAANFTRAELPDLVAYLHDHNVKGYVTFNTLIFSDELPLAVKYAEAIAGSGADAVIVQDLGLLRLLRHLVPSLPVHASTQMTQTEAGGIEYLRALGVSRVILARELSLVEIGRIARATSMPLEVFVHGALCISYSGQCLASEALWGRSANRGLCGQTCRLPYDLIVDGQPLRSGDGHYVLSPRDLAAHDRIPQLVELGIAGFKIEGRLKSALYVAASTQVYRAAIDAALQGTPFTPAPQQAADLAQSFSRGFGHGFLDGIDHQSLVQSRFAKSRGILIGTVVVRTQRRVVVELADAALAGALKPGDGVVFDEGHPEREEQGGRVYSVKPDPDAARVVLTFGRDDVHLETVALGSRVWKTDDPAMRRRLESSYQREGVPRRAPLRVRATARVGEPLNLDFSDAAGHAARVTWEQPLRPAEKNPLTVELLSAQLGRLGDTPFELAAVELVGDAGLADVQPVMVPKSVLNDLRRRAVHALLEQRAAAARHAVVEPDTLNALRRDVARVEDADNAPRLHVLVRSLEQLAALLQWQPATLSAPGVVYCDFAASGDYGRAVALARAAGRPIGLATRRILMPGEERELESLADLAPDAVLVRNLGSVCLLRRRRPDLALVGDHSLNVANELAANLLLTGGLVRLTPSYDLNGLELAAMLGRVSPAACEVVLHQHMPLFHTRHCLFAANLSDGPRCGDCGWGCGSHELGLRDRVGAVHPVLADGMGRNTVFNAAVQSAAELVPVLRDAGVCHFRVELLQESGPQACELLDLYASLLVESGEPSRLIGRLRGLCPAGFTRGTYAHEDPVPT